MGVCQKTWCEKYDWSRQAKRYFADILLEELRPWLEQNGHHFPDDIFKCIFVKANWCFDSTEFVHNGPIDNLVTNVPADVLAPSWLQAVTRHSTDYTASMTRIKIKTVVMNRKF